MTYLLFQEQVELTEDAVVVGKPFWPE